MMNFRKIKHPIFLFLIIVFFSCANKKINILEFNKSVLKGKLENGLTYYLQNPNNPTPNIEFRFIVKAGSMEETDEQQGIAHLIEHLCFRGTKDFPGDSIAHYLKSVGSPLGADLNATTDFDQTIFKININQNDSTTIKNCIHILSQWAYAVNFTDASIASEKNIVEDEKSWDQQNQSTKDFPDTLMNTLFNNTRYAQRPTIGNSFSILQNASPNLIRTFYQQWYRPDLMGVVIAGNFNKEYVQKLILEYFNSLKNPAKELTKINCAIPPFLENKVICDNNKKINSASFKLYFSANKYLRPNTESMLKRVLATNIFLKLMQNRLNQLSQKEFSQTEAATIAPKVVGNKHYDMLQLSISPLSSDDGSAKIKAFTQALGAVRKNGFTYSELQAVIQSYLKFDAAYLNVINSSTLKELIEKMTMDYLGIDYDIDPQVFQDKAKKILPLITLKDIDKEAQEWFGNGKFVAFLNGFDTFTTPINTMQLTDEIATAINKGTVLIPPTSRAELSDSLNLQSGKIISEQMNTADKILTYHLSNGIIIDLNYGTDDSSNISFSAAKLGGYEKYKVPDFDNVNSCVNMVNAMGYGDFSYRKMQQLLQSEKINITHTVNANYYSIKGTSYNNNVEQLLMANAYMLLKPRRDTAAFNHYKQGLINNNSKISQPAYLDSIERFFSRTNPYLKNKFNPSKVELDKTFKIYQDEFGDGLGWHYSFAGKTDTTEFKHLIEKYLGGLPANNHKDKKNFLSYNLPPQGKFNIQFKDNNSNNGRLLKYYYGVTPNNVSSLLSSLLLKFILNQKLFEVLREQQHLIYSCKVLLDINENCFEPTYKFTLDIAADPKDIPKVNQSINNILVAISKNGGWTTKAFMEFKEKFLIAFEKIKPKNQLTADKSIHEKFWKINTSRSQSIQALKNISMKNIQSAAKEMLQSSNVLTVTVNGNLP